MYEKYKPVKWTTPVSDASHLVMLSLVDDNSSNEEGQLSITVQDLQHLQQGQVCFTFPKCPAYRNIMEEYRVSLWNEIKKQGQQSLTLIIPDSPWVVAFRDSEPLLEVHNSNLVHYMICTLADVIEVLSSQPPSITKLNGSGN